MPTSPASWKTWVSSADAAAKRWMFALLPLLAFFYYGAYFRSGLALTGEGGTNAVLAQRLMEGYIPLHDTFLGYNLLWFYPLMGIFEWTGPSYLAMRAFFFFVCTLSAILGAIVVSRVSRSGLLALAAGIILVLIPGMMFRNYMGFMGVLNQLALVSAFALPLSNEKLRPLLIGLAGAALGLTYLIRIEVGLLLTPVFFGLLFLFPLWPGRFLARLPHALAGGALAVALWSLVHLPTAIDASNRGYADFFWGQYTNFPRYMWQLLNDASQNLGTKKTTGKTASPSASFLPVSTGQTSIAATWKPRPPLSDVVAGKRARDRYFAASLYLPAAVSALFLAAGLAALTTAYIKRDEPLRNDALCVLTLTACSLALFPQYFFFRPDTPHQTEFMIPFIPAVLSVMALALRRAASSKTPLAKTTAFLSVTIAVLTVWIHFGHAWPKESAGTIAARKQNFGASFQALNGVDVSVSPENAKLLEGLRDAVLSHSKPDDWVIAIPYSPTINLMTARRSYLWNLYMDDSNEHGNFQSYQIAQIIKHRPAVIVIDNRDVNKTEASRFRNWASEIYAFVREHYRLAGSFGNNEVFVLEGAPLPLPPQPSA